MNREKLKSTLKRHRRQLHRIPELDKAMSLTGAYIKETLKKYSCKVTSIGDFGICAWFDFGKKGTIAFRSDMDALPVEEKCDIEYRSCHPGKMHACGHDGHMSVLLTLADYLDESKCANNNVLLIFQAAEETTGGADELCQSGIFEKYNVKCIFGLHLWPYLEGGVIASRPGAMMAKSSEIDVDIEGKSTHAAAYEEGTDALMAAASFLTDIAAEKEKIRSCDPVLLHFGKLECGTVRNAVAGQGRIEGTMRAFDMKVFNDMKEAVEIARRKVDRIYGTNTKIYINEGYPPLINDEKLFREIEPCLKDQGMQVLKEPVMISEDFSFYGRKVPSVFFFLGTGTGIPLHSDIFDFDENILEGGFKLFETLVLNIKEKK